VLWAAARPTSRSRRGFLACICRTMKRCGCWPERAIPRPPVPRFTTRPSNRPPAALKF